MADLPASTRTLGRLAERYMADECRITKEGGEPVYDEETLTYTDPPRDTVYQGKCRIVPSAMAERVVESAGEMVTLKSYTVYLPREVEDVREGHQIEATSSLDPDLQGQKLWVKDVLFATHQPARKVIAEFQQEEA